MISEETSKYKTIDSLIRQGRSFAIYRIPGEETPRFVMQASGSARLFYDIEDLNEQQGFVIAPFKVNSECPIALIRPDYSELPDSNKKECIPMDLEFHPNETENASERKTKGNYIHCFDVFIKPLQERTLDKLVLSRSLTIDRENGFSPALIIGVPVGFVHVVEAKELIMQTEVPYIVARGRKGGSNIAAAICNAMLYAPKKENV